MDQQHTYVIVNSQAGTVRSRGTEAVHRLITAALGPAAQVELVAGAGIEARLSELLSQGGISRLIIGGGDGTLGSAARLVAGTGVALGILPLGTMNLMAQALGMAPDLEAALAQLGRAEVHAVDAGRANGRLFLHHVSFGLQPRMVRIRDKLGYSSRLTKILAAARATLAVLLNPRTGRLRLRIDDADIELRTPGLAISNNLYENAMVLKQQRLDEAVLGIYALRPMSLPAVLRLALDVLRGRWRSNVNVTERRGRVVLLTRPGRFGHARRSIKATIDGELTQFSLPLRVESVPAALHMLVPRPAPD